MEDMLFTPIKLLSTEKLVEILFIELMNLEIGSSK